MEEFLKKGDRVVNVLTGVVGKIDDPRNIKEGVVVVKTEGFLDSEGKIIPEKPGIDAFPKNYTAPLFDVSPKKEEE